VKVLTRNSEPRGTPDELYRWPKTSAPGPSWPRLVQTTTKLPNWSMVTAGWYWVLVVKVLTWSSGPRGAPEIAVLVSAAVFVVYALGACRTIYVGDSGELVTAVAVLGIPHPPGYPLDVLLGKLWTLLVPAGSIAFRMSLFSAFCGALAGGVLYRLARATGRR
jgi:hypothetical protein